MRLKNSSAFTAIQLAEGNQVPKRVQVLRTGKFNHPSYGEFEITSQVLSEMKANHDKKVRGIDTAFDYFHESDKEASAWVQELILEENGTELWAKVDWTPKAEKKLAERELRYFSPDFSFKWTDPETGVVHSNVLFGGGLTNRPFVKEMKAIVASENIKGDQMNLEQALAKVKEVEATNLKLSEEKSEMQKQLEAAMPMDKAAELKKQIADLQAQLAKLEGEKQVALEEKKKADEAKALAEKETAFNVLLSEGKAVAAQKEAFMKNDMNEFIKLAQPVNLKGSGSGGDETISADDKAVLKLAEEKRKASPNMTMGEAILQAKRELTK